MSSPIDQPVDETTSEVTDGETAAAMGLFEDSKGSVWGLMGSIILYIS